MPERAPPGDPPPGDPLPGDPLPRPVALAALAALAAWAFWDRWQFLSSTPFPLGVDGYWYPIQLRALLTTGHLYYPSEPLALWLMAPLAWLTSPVTGAKLGAAAAGAALPVTSYLVARRIAGTRAPALLAAAVVATSAGGFYLATEFIKTQVALPIALGAVAALAWTLERPSRRRAALAVALLGATGMCHKLGLAFALVAAAPVVLVHLARRGVEARWLALAAALPVLALVALVAADAQVLTGLLSRHADWSLPALRMGRRALFFRHEPTWAGLAGLAVLLGALAGRRIAALRPGAARAEDRALALGPALWAVAVALPWLDATSPEGLTFRLRAVSFLPLALCAAALLATGPARARPTLRMALAMFAAGLALYRPARYQAPVVAVDRDLAGAVAAAAGRVPPGRVLITPERHIAFMAVWYTGVETRLRPGSVPPARRERLVPMSYMTEDLVRAIDQARAAPDLAPPISLHPGNPDGLVLMPEATWNWVLGRLPPREAAAYRRWPTH